MILSDREIRKAVESGSLGFDPPFQDEDLSPSSVDVHLGAEVHRFRDVPPALIQAIDLGHPQVHQLLLFDSELVERIPIGSQGYRLQHLEFVLAQTRERVKLPGDLGARIEGRSTNARFGIVIHATAPTIHPTFEGHITLEICNFGKVPCILREGMAIGQLIFEQVLGTPSQALRSHWQGQGP